LKWIEPLQEKYMIRADYFGLHIRPISRDSVWIDNNMNYNVMNSEIIRESDMKTDYDSSGIETDYFFRARIEPIKTDYNRLK